MELKEYRAKMKAIGYKVAIKTYSEFKGCSYTKDGVQVPTGVLNAKTYEAHKAFYELREQCRGKVNDFGYRVVV